MAEIIPSLWPDDIKVDVLPPIAILRVQAESLSKATHGILKGVVETEESDASVKDGTTQHRLVIIAPGYNRYRHELITAVHKTDLPYPVEIEGESLYTTAPNSRIAYDEDQMISLVGKVLKHHTTKAVIMSLIAKSNEPKRTSMQPENNPSDNDE